jgi:hypothetical protein
MRIGCTLAQMYFSYEVKSSGRVAIKPCETVAGMDASAETIGIYSRRVSQGLIATRVWHLRSLLFF